MLLRLVPVSHPRRMFARYGCSVCALQVNGLPQQGTPQAATHESRLEVLRSENRVLQAALSSKGLTIPSVALKISGARNSSPPRKVGTFSSGGHSRSTLAEITEGARSRMEGSELRMGATVLLHDLVSRGDLNSDGVARCL